ncbi:xanthine dehydrogenase accessory protein XdhC [Primorskyibacter sp. S187A]|uniref:xanthine dehydrogenase accessory protein XdhC n=1 Tax=Primorskyibacter sp. S187A TaxID=3415130 RepID=UPI003C7C75C7
MGGEVVGFDKVKLAQAVAAHGRVARVVIAQIRGSSPREVGAAMLVWQGGQSGTIGGGALEFAAAQAALERDTYTVSRHALGPELGQCCGGAVTLVTEVFDAERVAQIPDSGVFARGIGDQPLAVMAALRMWRQSGQEPCCQFTADWMIEPVAPARRPLWIWGAGHVGRALVEVLAPLPDARITWLDVGLERFPDAVPSHVNTLPSPALEQAMARAPHDAHHLVLTYSHALDLALCHAGLCHGFASLGLIGSETKWARFRKRLMELGHTPQTIDRITCPIGDPALGKHPHAIAVGVAARYLQTNWHPAAQSAEGPRDEQGHPDDRHASRA